MAKIDPTFSHDMFKFIHKPIREADKKQGRNFVERLLIGPQTIFEDTQAKIQTLGTLLDPELTPQPRLLKDQVGFTRELNNITNDITDNDLRKLISLAVALWKQKGTEPGYANIVRLFTGKTARIFNWFDFRMIVGEKAFGEEQLGEDSWLISVPGVELSQDPSNNVVALFTFEGNPKDRSLTRNDGSEHGLAVNLFYFNTSLSGFPQGSTKFVRFLGGQITVNNSSAYDLSTDWTVEAFIRPTGPLGLQTLIHKMDGAGKGFKIEINTTTNELQFTISDGTNTVSKILAAAADLDDGVLRHIALVADRTNDRIRMWLNGTEATSIEPFGSVGDVTNLAPIVFGGSAVGVSSYLGDMDNFRLALNAVYDTSSGTLLVPLSGFIEFQEELLDEFQTDIRIVDEGDLNKTLILRILNLMRPVSERINVVFIRFFDDFIDGIGQFETLAGNAAVNTSQQMELQPSSFVRTDVLGDSEFRDIIVQTKLNDTDVLGGEFSVVFFIQDATNFYEYRINTATQIVSLFKVVAGVPTQIGADILEDLVSKTSYVFTVATSFNPLTLETQIQTFVDSNKQHEILDTTFNKGKFGYKTDSSTIIQIDEIEMLQLPVDVQRINPGFDL